MCIACAWPSWAPVVLVASSTASLAPRAPTRNAVSFRCWRSVLGGDGHRHTAHSVGGYARNAYACSSFPLSGNSSGGNARSHAPVVAFYRHGQSDRFQLPGFQPRSILTVAVFFEFVQLGAVARRAVEEFTTAAIRPEILGLGALTRRRRPRRAGHLQWAAPCDAARAGCCC